MSVVQAQSAGRAPPRPRVLLVGFDSPSVQKLEAQLDASILPVDSADAAYELLAEQPFSVLCLGRGLRGHAAKALLDTAIARHPDPSRHHVVLAAAQTELFQELVDRNLLYYLSPEPLADDDVASLLESALDRPRPLADRKTLSAPADAARLLELGQRLLDEDDLAGAADLAAAMIRETLQIQRGFSLLYDSAAQTLWRRPPLGGEDSRESAAAGLVSFVIRTGKGLRVERLAEDPRYDPDSDNDGGSSRDRFLAAPVVAASDRQGASVLAVLVALRGAEEAPFDDSASRRLGQLAQQVAPVFERLALARAEKAGPAQPAPREATLFRQQAIETHERGASGSGDVLRISPQWTAWAYRLLLAAFLVGAIYLMLGSVQEWSTGVAVVRVEGRTEVTASVAGTVTGVSVEAGQRVEAGEPLATLYSAQEAAELARIEREFELELANRLRHPGDPAIARTVGTLRGQKLLAAARLEQRVIRAPTAGLVSDLRIQPGQHLSPGHTVVTLVKEESDLHIVAMFPGHYRPLLETGMSLRFEPRGYRYAYQHLEVDQVGDDVVGPAEARRFLGAGLGDAVILDGPVVFVRAQLPGATFESDGETYRYHDGIQGIAEVRVRSEPILTTLWPGLKALFSDRHG